MMEDIHQRLAEIVTALRALGFEVSDNMTVLVAGREEPVEKLLMGSLPTLIDSRIATTPVALNLGRHLGGYWRVCELHMVALPFGDPRICPICEAEAALPLFNQDQET